jgi:hypothetical protein
LSLVPIAYVDALKLVPTAMHVPSASQVTALISPLPGSEAVNAQVLPPSDVSRDVGLSLEPTPTATHSSLLKQEMPDSDVILNCFRTVQVLPSLSPMMAGNVPTTPIAMQTTTVGHETELKPLTEGVV